MTNGTNFAEMPTILDPNQYLKEYRMDMESANKLRQSIQDLNQQIDPLKKELVGKKGAQKGAITRQLNPLLQERDVLVKLLKENAAPTPRNEAELVSMIIDKSIGLFHSAVQRLAEIQLGLASFVMSESNERGSILDMAYNVRWNGEDLFKQTEAVRFWADNLDREHMVNFTTLAQLHTFLTGVKRLAVKIALEHSMSRSSGVLTNVEDDCKHDFYLDTAGRYGRSDLDGLLWEIEYYWDAVVSYRLANPDAVTQLPNGGTKKVNPIV